MAAYAAFALPILIPVLLVLEKITRTKGEQKTEINKICDVLPAKNTTSERYDKISRWYDKIVFLFERKHMLSGIEKLSPKPGEQILEIGTGTGSMIIEIARQMNNKGKVYGVDISEEMIRKAKKNIQRSGLCNITDIQVGDAYKLKFADNFFDAVFMCFTLELFPTDDIPVILKECSRVLKPRGRIIRAC